MRFSTSLVAAAAALSGVNAAHKGFNYGAFFNDQSAKVRADFEYEFNAAKQLPGTNGQWTSARLYTMIQHGTTNSVIEAIQAAINTKTSLLLGLWASSPQDVFNNEITALKAAVAQYGTAFTDLVVGISVGSEDLYRITPTGIQNHAGVGAEPNQLINYIRQTRDAIKGTGLAGKPIGHVDTWTAYVNGSNNGVISELDFLGVDAYPYFQTTMANSIENANATFYDAFHATVAAAQGKPVWVTETGWPVSGAQQNQAVASTANARIYWEDVTCSLLAANVNLFYYTLQDAQKGNPSPSFGIKPAGDLQQVKPLYDLSCPATNKAPPAQSSSSSSSSKATATSTQTPSTTSSPISTSTPTPTPVAPSPPSTTLAPDFVIPIDHSHPSLPLGNQPTGHISTTFSTLLRFTMSPSHAGKTCTLTLTLPPTSSASEWFAPFVLTSPGGILVSRLDDAAAICENATADGIGASVPVGVVGKIEGGNRYEVFKRECEVGVADNVAYLISAVSGLEIGFVQALGLGVGWGIVVQ